MSYIITPFEVSSKSLAEPVKIRFVHLLSGIATRHRDSIDVSFLVNGQKVLVAIACAALNALRDREHKFLTDQQLAEIAAQALRKHLEAGYDPALVELFMEGDQLRALAREKGFIWSCRILNGPAPGAQRTSPASTSVRSPDPSQGRFLRESAAPL